MLLEEDYVSSLERLMHETRAHQARQAVKTLMRFPGYRSLYKMLRGEMDIRFTDFADEALGSTKVSFGDAAADWKAAAVRERAEADEPRS